MAEAPERDGVLGSGLHAMNRVATVVGTALDSFVEVRFMLASTGWWKRPLTVRRFDSQGGLDSLGVKPVSAAELTPDARIVARRTAHETTCSAQLDAVTQSPDTNAADAASPQHAAAASWGGFEDTPFSPPRPVCRSSAVVPLEPQLHVGPHAALAVPREAEDLAEQVRVQLQQLLVEKARLAQENARLERENRNLQELLSFATSAAQPEDAPPDDESDPLDDAAHVVV